MKVDIRVDVVGKDELLGAELIVNKLQIPLTAKVKELLTNFRNNF